MIQIIPSLVLSTKQIHGSLRTSLPSKLGPMDDGEVNMKNVQLYICVRRKELSFLFLRSRSTVSIWKMDEAGIALQNASLRLR